jgi:hypothetical protein
MTGLKLAMMMESQSYLDSTLRVVVVVVLSDRLFLALRH